MWSETNPTSLYLGTTWELITSNKYIKTGSTALQIGGSDSVGIAKDNLPDVKLTVDSFSLSRGTMDISGKFNFSTKPADQINAEGAFGKENKNGLFSGYAMVTGNTGYVNFLASRNWSGTSTSASPSTETLGSGTLLNIQPSYITLKFWKRLS